MAKTRAQLDTDAQALGIDTAALGTNAEVEKAIADATDAQAAGAGTNPDGAVVATSEGGVTRLVGDPLTGSELDELKHHLAHAASVAPPEGIVINFGDPEPFRKA